MFKNLVFKTITNKEKREKIQELAEVAFAVWTIATFVIAVKEKRKKADED